MRKMATPPARRYIISFIAISASALLLIIVVRFNTNDHIQTTSIQHLTQQQFTRRLSEEIIPGPILNEQIIQDEPSQQSSLSPEEIQEKHIKQYLGGLYPKVDRQFHPLYLRDTLHPRTIDPKWGEVVDGDIPFFWHIPKASGSTMKNIMNFCFNLKRAEKVYGEASINEVRPNVINMDVSSPEGLKHAFDTNLLNENIIDVLVSNYFTSGSALFTPQHHGRAFTIMRHPIDLAESLFYYRRKASWEPSYRRDWNKITFAQYVASDEYIGNWMVHQLTGTMPWVELTEAHLEQAKSVLQAKVFVGISSQMDETVRQLKQYFHWMETQPFCVFNYLHSTPTNSNSHPKLERGGEQWMLVAEREKWDMSLYYYALELFAEQRERFPPEDKGSEALVSVMDNHH